MNQTEYLICLSAIVQAQAVGRRGPMVTLQCSTREQHIDGQQTLNTLSSLDPKNTDNTVHARHTVPSCVMYLKNVRLIIAVFYWSKHKSYAQFFGRGSSHNGPDKMPIAHRRPNTSHIRVSVTFTS